MKNKKVIYTALFGNRGSIQEPKVVPQGWDFICFTDRKDLVSKVWDIRTVEPVHEDPVRNARMHKVLAHKFLPDYEISVWIDANLCLKKNPDELVEKYLTNHNLAVFDHKNNIDSIDCLYKEAEHIFKLQAGGRYKDDPELIKKQIKKYRDEGYPENNGLAVTMVLLRRHNKPDALKAMEEWWKQISENSRRDQLSFNYATWKTKLDFMYLPGDSRNNEWFEYRAHQKRTVWERIKKVVMGK